jgi:ribose transport system substrate-binding protein
VLDAAGRKDIVIVGYDATPDAQAAIRRGSPLKADVVLHPKTIGRTAIEMVARSLDGQAVPPLLAVDVGLVDHETLGGKLNDD